MPGTRLAWDSGLGIATDSDGGEFDPEVVAPPSTLPERVIVAECIDSVAIDGTNFTPAVRAVSVPYARTRIVVGGKDVTYFRGVQTPDPMYGLVSPLLYGAGAITFPQIHAAYERPGVGDLSWLTRFATVRVQQVDADDNVLSTDFRGFIADFQHNGRDVACTLGGEATGRAAMVDRPVPVFPKARDIGGQVMHTIQHILRLPVANSPTTGVEIAESGGSSQLDFLTNTLALSTERDGTQWTVMPGASGKYRMAQKDLSTIAASVYIDGFHVRQDLRRDFTEEPNRIWSSSVDPDGRRNRHWIFPGLVTKQWAFPGSTLHPGDTGDDVFRIIWRLVSTGWLDHGLGVEWTTDPDDPVTEAIENVQSDANLTVNGNVNAATWRAIFRGDNYSLRRAQQKPTAQWDYTRAFNLDASGNVLGPNPKYVRSRLFVDKTVDMGFGLTRQQDNRYSNRELVDGNTPNWVGTITVNTGAVIDGEHNIGDPLTTGDVRDARTVKPGMNLWLANFGGTTEAPGTLVHVSGVQVSAGSVEYAVDTRARDTMAVWAIIARNRESRRTPARQWDIAQGRARSSDDMGGGYDGGPFGKIERTELDGDTWTKIPTPAGRSGLLQLIDLKLEDPAALFSVAFFGKEPPDGWADRQMGDPFGKPFAKRVERNTEAWQDNRYLVDVFGNKDQPCGYWPRHLDPDAFNLVSQLGASVDSGSDTFTLSHHGYSNGDQVYFSAGSVPDGLTADNDYFVIAATANTFKVSASKGGSAMNVTSDKSGVTVSIHADDTPPVTGKFRYRAGLPYFCKGDPVLWMLIRPDRDTTVQGGRVLELLLDDAAG